MIRIHSYLPLLAALLSLSPPARAQSYTVAESAGNLSSISATGTAIPLSDVDDGFGTINAPFPFSAFGQTIPQGTPLYVSSNGMLAVFDSTNAYENLPIPSSMAPNAFIAPFWDDLTLQSGEVSYAVQGTVGNRALVVEWSNALLYQGSENFSFQIKVYELDGRIETYYAGSASGGSGTIGVEDASGSLGASAACSPNCTPSSLAGTRFTFTPSEGGGADLEPVLASKLPGSVSPGGFVSIIVEVSNLGDTTAPATQLTILASLDDIIDSSDFVVTSVDVAAIAAGDFATLELSFEVPAFLPTGRVFVGARADAQQTVVESNEANNFGLFGSITVTGGGTVAILTESLPSGRVGDPYEATLRSSPSAAFSVLSGSVPGLEVSSSGVYSGIPSRAGTYYVTFEATAAGVSPGTAEFQVIIAEANALAITTNSLPEAAVGVPYSARLQASGGSGTYQFSLVDGPSWLVVGTDGSLSGQPEVPGEHTVSFEVDDGESTARKDLVMVVRADSALSVSTRTLSVGAVDVPYEATLQASGGTPPYTFQLASGVLPTGLSVSENGHITGTPTMEGSRTFTVRVTDSAQATATAELSIEIVRGGELSLTVPSQVTVPLRAAAEVRFTAEGGQPPYSFALQGLLPEGLVFDADLPGLSGTATSSVATTVVVTVTDSAQNSDSAEIVVHAVLRTRPAGTSSRTRDSGCGCQSSGSPTSSAWAAFALFAAFHFRRRRGTHLM